MKRIKQTYRRAVEKQVALDEREGRANTFSQSKGSDASEAVGSAKPALDSSWPAGVSGSSASYWSEG